MLYSDLVVDNIFEIRYNKIKYKYFGGLLLWQDRHSLVMLYV